jgi:DtxR family Mn-dependent transcriptional regulator
MDRMNMQKLDQLTHSTQDYLKAIYSLTRNGQPTSTLQVADALGVRPASVTHMLQKMDEAEPRLVIYRKHHGVRLSPEGEVMALRLIRRHRLIELFLHDVLDYPWERVHTEAEVLEHAISPFFEERLAEYLENPRIDPHGDLIPSRSLAMKEERSLVSLTRLETDQHAIVRRVSNQSVEMLSYLGEIGLQPGANLRVLKRNPVDGTMQVQINGQKDDQVLGEDIGQQVWVEMSPKL